MWRQIVPLAVALLAFTAAVELGGSGFIAAFVGGMAFGYVSRERQLSAMYFTEQAGDLLAALVWIGFGAAALAWAAPHVTWQIVVYALLSLTVVRMLPVAIAFWRTGAKPQTVAFIGWFGPRGLASIVFALLALEEGVPDSTTLLTTVVVTVALSVLAHGLTSAPLVGVYQRWYTSRADEHPSSAEAAPAALPRARRPLAASGSHVLRRADD
jgi:NhaP-type Na+/H+ or K+/H+ antiporter